MGLRVQSNIVRLRNDPIPNQPKTLAIYTQSLESMYPSILALPLGHCCKDPELSKKEEEMKVIAAYLLAVLGGNTCPSAVDIKNILGSVGAEADDDKIELLLSQVKGKDITELIAAGREKLASVPAGGGGAVAVAAVAGGGAPATAPAAESKKEEKVEEKEESDDDMGFSLFD